MAIFIKVTLISVMVSSFGLVSKAQRRSNSVPVISLKTLTSNGAAEIPENSQIGTFLAHVSAYDPDGGEVSCFVDDSLFQLCAFSEGVKCRRKVVVCECEALTYVE